jgi:hypothetical protein
MRKRLGTPGIEKREFYKIKKGKIEEKGTIPVKSANGNRAPHVGLPFIIVPLI